MVSAMRSAVMVTVLANALGAQTATLRGRVLTDSTERPVAGVVVAIDELKLQALSDSLGNFTLIGIKPGAHIVTAKKIGFGALATRVRFAAKDALDADFLMTPNVQDLPDVTVEAKRTLTPRMADFEARRVSGNGGRFLTQADLEKRPFATLTDALRQLPGIDFTRSNMNGRERYAVAGRMSQPACVMCGGPQSNGVMVPCYAAVVLDGAFVYGAGENAGGKNDERKFDINSIDPSTLAGVEFYVGPATMPVQYNATRHTCGLLVLWTK